MDFGLSDLNSDMGSSEDYDPEYSDPDACLNPVDRLEKYVESEHMYSRQLAARSLLETIQQVDEFSDAERVLKVLSILANDADGVVRTELCEQLAQIGNVCAENRTIFTAGDVFYDPLANDILPVIFRYMTDPHNQVRKTSQTALADLVEQRLISTEDIVSKVSPIVSKLASMDSSEDHRSEAASLLCRLAPIVGAEQTEKLFLDHFLNFCTDHVFQIRKICAVNFGSICHVVGREKTESVLLEKFFFLCTDAIWGVRKACTECFMQVSLVCSPAVRHSQLSAVFINLIADQSRWVRMAAFEALGGFISTFANPSTTGLLITEEGALVAAEPCVVLDERNGVPIENVEERVSDLKEELVKTVDDVITITTDSNSVVEMNSVGVIANGVSMNEESGEKSLDISESCNGDVLSDFVSQDHFYAGNDVGPLREVSHCKLAPGCQNNCNGEHSDGPSLEPTVAATHLQGAHEHDILNSQQRVCENGIEKLESSANFLENCAGEEEVRWNLSDVENRNVNFPGNKSGNVFADESLSASNHVSAAENFNVSNFCLQNELLNGHGNATIDTCMLDTCLECNVIHTAADKMTQQFGSLNFWQKIVPEIDETSRSDAVNDSKIQHSENSLFFCSDSEILSAAQNLLNSKLLCSVSHLSDSVAAVTGIDVPIHVPTTGEIDNGEVGFHDQTESDINESSSVPNVEPMIEISRSELRENPDLGESVESEGNDSVSPMECDDENHAEMVTESETQSLILETDEIPLGDESTCSARNDVYKPMLQLLDDLTDHKSTAMDVGEAVDLENGVEVDEEEIRELVAAAKDMPCDDIAIYKQDVVPSDLLEQYLGMMDPSCAQKVDSEITRHCAYSLPAVAYTLGRKNWSSLKNLYMALAADVQWKVRRTLAFSIHELALIVGEEITSRDLVPVFDGFLNDLDEVRIGVLKHLADFLKLLSVEARRGYLMKIDELLTTDNSRNWRFREELARQLFLLLELFTVADIQEHISPIALHLAEDRVAQVRLAAVRVLSHIVKQLAVPVIGGTEHNSAWTSYFAQLTEQFANSSRCTKRQMYVQLCNYVLQDRVVSDDYFADKFLPILLSLRHDAIPNVRLTLARTVAQHIKHSEFFTSSKNPHREEVMQTVAALQEDRDRDVRFLINVKPDDVLEHSSVEIVA